MGLLYRFLDKMRKELAAASSSVEVSKGGFAQRHQIDQFTANRENRINAHNAVNDLMVATQDSLASSSQQQFRI